MKKRTLFLLLSVFGFMTPESRADTGLDERCPATLTNDQLAFFKKNTIDVSGYSNPIELRGANYQTRFFYITEDEKEKFLRANPSGLKKIITESFRLIYGSEKDFKRGDSRKILNCTYGRKATIGSSEYQFDIFSFLER